MSQKLTRSERLDALVAHLRASGSASMTELSEELGVSTRTLRRDVDTLRARGMDIEGERGRGGGIRFSRFAPLPPLQLDAQQVVGLWLSVQLARQVAGLPFSRGSNAGLNKVLAALPGERRQQLRRLCSRIVVGRAASSPMRASLDEMCPTLLDVFERCFRSGLCMSFRYRDRVGSVTQRRVEPHGILVRFPLWYVLAVDIDKRAQRMFRMDRISNPRAFGRGFEASLEVIEEMMGEIPYSALAPPNA